MSQRRAVRQIVNTASAAVLMSAILGCAVGATRAFAQEQPAAASAEDRAQTFQAVTGATKEDVPGGPLLIAAYAVVWLSVFGYVLRLGRLHSDVEQSLSRVESAVTRAGAATRAPGSE
jgi:CcmD family protein